MKALSQLVSIFIFISICCKAYGQDSLWQKVKESSSAIEQATYLSEIYRTNMYTDGAQSDRAANQLMANALSIKNDSLLSKAYKGKAQIKMLMSEYDSALYYLDLKENIISEKSDALSEKSNNHHLRGLIYYYQADYEKSIEQNFKAVNIRTKLGDKPGLTRSYNNLGISYERLQEYDKAIQYYNQSLAFTPSEDRYGRAALMSNMAVIYNNRGDYPKAKQLLLKAKPIADYIAHPTLTVDINSTLAQIYAQEGSYIDAIDITDTLLLQARQRNDIPRQIRFLNMKGSFLIDDDKAPESVQVLLEGITLSGNNKVDEHKEELYSNLGLAYKETGQLLKSLEAKDSLMAILATRYNEDKLKITEELDIKYKTALKDQELLSAQQKITKRSYQRNYAILISGVLLTFGYFLWRRSKYRQQKIENANKLQAEKILNLEKEKKILSLASMIEGQESERTRIAQDLHDGLGGLLSSVRNHFSLIQEDVKKLDQLNIYDRTNSIIDQACKEVRRISHNLMPASLQLNGLVAAVDQYCQDVSNSTTIDVEFEHTGLENKTLDETTAIFLYRIIQEAITNARKHADATHLLVQIGLYEEEISLIIEDNGCGFEQDGESDGIGLRSIRSRVDFLKGHLDLDSQIDRGTTITINVPHDS